MKTESSFTVPHTGLQCDSIEPVLTAAGSHVHDFYKVCREGKYFFLKALKPEFRSREYYREVLRKEFELGQQLHSEYIVSYHQLLDTPEECGVLMDYVNGLTLTNIKFPPTLQTLRPHAFDDCRALGNLHLPLSVSSVMMAAFINCRGLTHVDWPATITEVPRNCFVSCHSLRSFTLPEGVTIIHQDAFCDCQQLQEIDLPESLQRIDRGAFYKCLSLERITLPSGLLSLGEYLFYDCPRLQEINVLATTPPTVSSIVTRDFQGVVRVPAAAIHAYRRAPGWKHLRLEPLNP